MKVTRDAENHLNQMAVETGFSDPVLFVKLKRNGCSGYSTVFEMVPGIPEDFDITWFCFTESGWNFTVVFREPDLMESVLDYKAVDSFNTKLVLDIKAAQNFCGCGESFALSAA